MNPSQLELPLKLQTVNVPQVDLVDSQTLPVGMELRTILQRLNQITYSVDQQEMDNQALDLLIELTGADSATFLRLDSATHELVVEAIRNDAESLHLVGLRLPVQEAFLAEVQEQSQPIVVGDLPEDPRWIRVASPTSAARLVNMISLPLVAQDCLLGVVQIYNFRQVDLGVLDLVRERLAIEVERRSLLDSTLTMNKRLHALVEAIGEISGKLDRKQILHTVLELSAALVEAERSSIFLVDPASNEIGFQIAYQAPMEPHCSSSKEGTTNKVTTRSEYPIKGKPKQPVRSAITVPIRMQPTDLSQHESLRNMGGLMALNSLHGGFTPEDSEILEVLVKQASTFLEAAEILENLEDLFLDIIKALVTAIDAKDSYTQGHSHRVSEYSVLIAQKLGLSPTDIYNIRIGSLLHDVGKIGIPDSILIKNGKLNDAEWIIIKNHPLTGWNILRQVSLLEPMLPAIIEHHEKLDGSGYPYSLRGEQISLMGRIVAVADVFDAMTSDRPYRKALSVVEVINYLVENVDTLFDRSCVEALRTIIGSQVFEGRV